MNHTKSLVGTLAALAVASSLFAQTTSTSGAGLLGQRYVSASAALQDIRDIDVDMAYVLGLNANVPVTSYLDVGLGYSYTHFDDFGLKIEEHAVAASATAYRTWSGFKPFVDVSVGHGWLGAEAFGSSAAADVSFWSAGAGVEVPVLASTAVTVAGSYLDAFESGSEGYWRFSGGVSHWFTDRIAGLAAVSFLEDDSIIYQLGAAFRF